ncbi:MAG: ABC transporter substrate-binding protein [Deltaproteobacteria bacterium]|nr:ABC transporter substrate-binding protein [Deltaproteobacteria bacterium]
MTIEDARGRKVRLSLPIKTVVALNSDILEILRTLKAEDCVAGVFSEVVREREFWGDLAQRPKVGSWREPNMEAIAALKPDLVIAYSRNPGQLLENKMALFGIQVLRLDFYKVDTLEREVRVMGQLLNREKEAVRFCDWYRRHLGVFGLH